MFGYVLLVLSTLAVVPTLSSEEKTLSCYKCNSHLDPNCETDPPSDVYKVRCEPGQNVCRKITQSVEKKMSSMKSQYDERVIRGCGVDSEARSSGCYRVAGLGVTQRVCSCNSGDYCN